MRGHQEPNRCGRDAEKIEIVERDGPSRAYVDARVDHRPVSTTEVHEDALAVTRTNQRKLELVVPRWDSSLVTSSQVEPDVRHPRVERTRIRLDREAGVVGSGYV